MRENNILWEVTTSKFNKKMRCFHGSKSLHFKVNFLVWWPKFPLSIKMNLSQKSYSLKNLFWWTWFWKSAISKTLCLVYLSRCSWLQRENLENSWQCFSLNRACFKSMSEWKNIEENENKLVNISIYKRSVKSRTFKNMSSCFQMFFKNAILMNLTKLTGKHLCWCLFFDKVIGL